MAKHIEIYKAYQNNLKGVNVKIPLGSFTVICGLSGSGKSSLAFDTLYAEGQRRYLENLSNYLKQYIVQQPPPQVEKIFNLPPALALEQKNNVKSSRSTVASLSGLADHLRLLFEQSGQAYCPQHGIPLEAFSPDKILKNLLKEFKGKRAFILIPVLIKGVFDPKLFLKKLQAKGYYRLLFPKKNQKLNLKDIKTIEIIKRLPKKDFYILFDRFIIEEKSKERLRDSFKQAFSTAEVLSDFRFAFQNHFIVQILNGEKRIFSKKKQCSQCSYEFPYPLNASLFSFNSPLGACKICQGYGYTLDIDEKKVVPFPKLSLEKGAIQPFEHPSTARIKFQLKNFCKKSHIPWNKPWCDLSLKQRTKIWKGDKGFKGVQGYFKKLEAKRYKMHVRIFLARYKSPFICKNCKGTRLKPEINQVRFLNKNFNYYMKMNLRQMQKFLEKNYSFTQKTEAVVSAIFKKLKYGQALGLSYLSLNRPVNTLSGGEFQRLNLSSQLGLNLSQVLYVLDEPTVGLHPRDSLRMIELLKELQKQGNSIVVVEHDQEMIESSDYVIELGPEAGEQGGQILWSGYKKDFYKQKKSNTVPYLKRKSIPLKNFRPVNKSNYKYRLLLKNCSGNNLKNLDLFIPLNRFVLLSGVSGSGKSSLVSQTLYPALKQEIKGEILPHLPYEKLEGHHFLKDVVLMSQLDVVRSSRSFVASYIKVFETIRKELAQTTLAKRLGFSASNFSLNVDGGRCSTCKGKGFQEVDMLFMDSIKTECEECKGKKFKKEILKVQLKNKNIHDLLNMTVQEAFDFFRSSAPLLRAFSSLNEVGLSYLTLGQSLSSLSGGERQRLKLSRELLKSKQGKTLYILDEPTKGLHFKELDLLLKVIDRLIDTGASFLVIEHNLDFIKSADYIIDIGPEAGQKGGKILVEGSPIDIMACKNSRTGQCLKKFIYHQT